jgi:hypothetical protein
MPHFVKLDDGCRGRFQLFTNFSAKSHTQRSTAGVDTVNMWAMLLSESPKVYNKTAVIFSLAGRPRGDVLVN